MKRLNKDQVIDLIQREVGNQVPKSQIRRMLNAFIKVVKSQVAKGRAVGLLGFGTWYPSTRAARRYFHPRKRVFIDKPERRSVKFKPSKRWFG